MTETFRQVVFIEDVNICVFKKEKYGDKATKYGGKAKLNLARFMGA